jgi:hypothetical protein
VIILDDPGNDAANTPAFPASDREILGIYFSIIFLVKFIVPAMQTF